MHLLQNGLFSTHSLFNCVIEAIAPAKVSTHLIERLCFLLESGKNFLGRLNNSYAFVFHLLKVLSVSSLLYFVVVLTSFFCCLK